MDGGTTFGYSEIGRPRTAIRPPRKISSDNTPAKIGRSMKNLEKFTRCSRECVGWLGPGEGEARAVVFSCRGSVGLAVVGGLHRDHLRRDQRARANALQSVDDHALARL